MKIDWEAVQEHLDYLHLDPSHSPILFKAWCKDFGRNFLKSGKPISQEVDKLLAQRPDMSLGFVVNPGGGKKAEITSAIALFTEDDSGASLDDQMVSWQGVMPEPGLSVFTGNKSIHHYWPLREAITPEQFTIAQRRLAAVMQAAHPAGDDDTSLDDPNQVMRVAGSIHPKTGKRAEIRHRSIERFSLQELEKYLTAAEARFNIQPSTTAAPNRRNITVAAISTANGTHYKDMTAVQRHAVVIDALRHCPERGEPDSNTYPLAQRILAALVHEFGADVALDLAKRADWSQNDYWDITNTARSLQDSAPEAGKRSRIWTVFDIAAEEARDPDKPWQCPWEEQQNSATPTTAGSAKPQGEALSPIDEWDELLKGLVDPNHKNFECNTVRRQIRAATAARELNVSASPQNVRATLLQHQRNLLTGSGEKGTKGGQKARFKPKQYLIQGLITMRCLTGIAAFNKVGKTKLAVELVASLINQQPFMGNPDWQPAPPPKRGHRFILWWVDQPGADSQTYLKARGLMEPGGTLHPQILKLYTEEDDLAWDDQGMDQLIQDTSENPGAILISDSFFACIQRIHGSDQEPEAGGALIDVQTLLSQKETTHVCLFHSPKETGPVGINAIRGHSSAGGCVSGVISMHFLEKKDPQNGKWVADKDNPHRRMVFEGRGPYLDLLIRGAWEKGTFEVLGNFQQKLGELTADERKAFAIDQLTEGQRQALKLIETANGQWKTNDGVTAKQVASAMTHPHTPTNSEIENKRKQLNALVKAKLLTTTKKASVIRYKYRTENS